MTRTLPLHRTREYETIYIVNPDVPPETLEQITTRLTGVVDRLKGKLLRAESWGRRKLAYPVRKHRKGTYVYLRYLGYSNMVHELERNMRMLEPVLKYLTVKVEEDVDPEARPAYDGEISFSREFDEEPERDDIESRRSVEDWTGEGDVDDEGGEACGAEDSGDDNSNESEEKSIYDKTSDGDEDAEGEEGNGSSVDKDESGGDGDAGSDDEKR